MPGTVLVDARNLHAGGGVQVAASFIDEMDVLLDDQEFAGRHPWIERTSIALSAEVRSNLRRSPRLELARDPVDSGYSDVVFTVFGPRYRQPACGRHLMGFADVTLVYPGVASPPTAFQRAKRALRTPLARRSFKSADTLVVETEATAQRLHAVLGIPLRKIHVVANTVNGEFFSGDPHTDSALARNLGLDLLPPADIRFIYVTRAYPHKNHAYIGALCTELERLGLSARAIITLTGDEWRCLDPLTKSVADNIGPVSLPEARAAYRRADAALFPSLLECFSAMPLEAMVMGLPVFASDRDFVRTVCGDAVAYIDPLRPRDGANKILEVWHDRNILDNLARESERLVSRMPTAEDRAKGYLSLIGALLET